MARQEKQQNTKCIPSDKQKNSHTIRYNRNGNSKHKKECFKIKDGHTNFKK